MSTHITDPTAMMTPTQRQELRAASDPIGTVADADAELDRLSTGATRHEAAIRKAGDRYRSETSLPESVSDDARQLILEAAEQSISSVEATARRDLAIQHARSRAIVSQLEEAAAEPNLSNVPPDVLDRANRSLPLVQSQVTGASLAAITKRLKAATVRDDESELLALAMVLHPVIAAKHVDPNGTDDLSDLWAIRDELKRITSRWRDRSLDAARARARTVERTIGDLDHRMLRGRSERTGDRDPYGFLDGMR